MAWVAGLTGVGRRGKGSRPRRRRQHDSNRGSLSQFESAAVLICHVLARTTPSRAPTSRSTRNAPSAPVPRASPLHAPARCTTGEHLSEVKPTPLGVSPIGREAALPLLLSRPCSAGSRPPEGSGLNSCSPVYTTANVSLCGRHAVGLPPC